MTDDLRKLREELESLRGEQLGMGQRLEALRRRLVHMERDLSPDTAPPPPARSEAPAEKTVGPAQPEPTSAGPSPGKGVQELEVKIGGVWLNRIGMIVFLLGAAFFIKLAYDWGWINEAVRITVGVAAALVLLWLGERNRRLGFSTYSQGLTGGGIALLYFTTFASFYYYDLIPSAAGIVLLVLVTIIAAATALYQDAPAVAVIGLLTGFLNPVLFMAEEPNFTLLMVYLILLNLGIISVIYYRRWNFLGIISFVLTSIFLGWTLSYRFIGPAQGLPAVAAQIYFSIFLLLFLAPPLLLVAVRRRSLEPLELFPVIAGAAVYYGLSWFNLQPDHSGSLGWFTLGLACFYLLIGFGLLPSARRDPRTHFTAFSLAAAFMALFVPLQLRGGWILAGWSAEAALLCCIGLRQDRRALPGYWLLLCLALLRLIGVEWADHPDMERFRFLINRAALLTFAFIALLLLLGRLYARSDLGKKRLPRETVVLAGAAGSLLLIFCSLEIDRYGTVLAWRSGTPDYYRNLALMAISLFWGLYAAALMAAGFIRKLPPLRYAAIGLFGLTVAKVILVDLSFLELAYRIISLVVSGSILLGASYLYQRNRDRIGPAS